MGQYFRAPLYARPQEKWRKEKEKTPAKGKASIVPAASLTPYVGIKLSLRAGKMLDHKKKNKKNGEKKRKTPS